MKIKALVLFLTLALLSWGQTSIPAAAPSDKASDSAETECACCQEMDAADHKSCCHSKKAGDTSAACCGKDKDSRCGHATKCVSTGAASATQAACCPGNECCAKGKSCCGEHMQTAKMKMACCGSQCSMHPTASEPVKN